MNISKTKSIFGPIPSRRLGLSLGIDLLPFKTCSMDCIYCECGATTNLTCKRMEYFPVNSVLEELDSVMAEHRKIDYITFSGVGEPTLHSGIGIIIDHIKKNYSSSKICLLTNGALLGDEKLQNEIAKIDLIVPSLDGSNEEEFQLINRPAKDVTLDFTVKAIKSFRQKNLTQMWLEIFIVPGVNDSKESIARFKSLICDINPDKVQLNSLDRPGVVDWIQVPDRSELEDIANHMKSCNIEIEIISKAKKNDDNDAFDKISVSEYNQRILKTLESRPCTADDIADVTNTHVDKIKSHLRRLERAGLITSEQGPRGTYYRKMNS